MVLHVLAQVVEEAAGLSGDLPRLLKGEAI